MGLTVFFFYILGLKSNCEPFLSLLVIFVANLFGTPCILQQSHGTSGIGYIVDVMSCCPPGFRCCDHWCDNPKVQPSHISQLHALVHQAGGLVQVEPCWCWSPGALVEQLVATAAVPTDLPIAIQSIRASTSLASAP